MAQAVFATGDAELARRLVEVKEEVRRLEKQSAECHLQRLREGRLDSMALFLHLTLPSEFVTLAAAIAHIRERRQLARAEWYKAPKPVLIEAAGRAAEWVRLIEGVR